MSTIVPTRLNDSELGRLDEMLTSNRQGAESRSEFIRLLLHREWNRRKEIGKPKPFAWQSAARRGRPVVIH